MAPGALRVTTVVLGLVFSSILLLSSPLQQTTSQRPPVPIQWEDACTQAAVVAAPSGGEGGSSRGGARDPGSPLRDLQLLAVPNLELDGKFCLELTLARHRHFAAHGFDAILSPGSQPSTAGEQELQRDRAPRTLWYETYAYADTVMDRFFLHSFCGSLAANPPLESSSIVMWGPGWPGWNASVSPAENIASRWAAPFELVVSVSFAPHELGLDGDPVYLTIRHECVWYEHADWNDERWACPFHDRQHPQPWKHYNITLLTYEKDLVALYKQSQGDESRGLFDGSAHALLSFWPHTVLPGSYVKMYQAQGKAETGANRTYDICLVGQTHAFHYPLRSKLAHWMEDGVFELHGLRSRMLPHFGYTEQDSDEERAAKQINVARLEQQYEQYIEFLFQCRATIVTRSLRDFELRKYVELAMAGSLMVGDVPTNSVWSELVVDIHDDVADDRVEAVIANIQHWLSEEYRPRRERKIHGARLLAFSQRTTQHAWVRIEQAYYQYHAGRRGFVRPAWLDPFELS